MNDDEIRIACINAVVAWTGSSNKLQDAQAFYEWIIAGRRVVTMHDIIETTPKGKGKSK